MCRRAEAEIGLLIPVFEVVPALIARLREIGDLILAVARRLQRRARRFIQRRGRVLVRQIQRVPPGRIRRPLLDFEQVSRCVTCAQPRAGAHRLFRRRGSLPADAQHQIQRHVGQARARGRVHGPFQLHGRMPPPEPAQLFAACGLHTHGQAVAARRRKRTQRVVQIVRRICLQRDLRAAQPEPPRRVLHQPCQSRAAQQRRRAAAEIQRVRRQTEPCTPAVESLLHRRGVGVHRRRILPGQRIKITVRAFGQAKGNVDVKADRHGGFLLHKNWAHPWVYCGGITKYLSARKLVFWPLMW